MFKLVDLGAKKWNNKATKKRPENAWKCILKLQNRAKLIKLRKRHLILKQQFYNHLEYNNYRLHLHFYLLWKEWIACALKTWRSWIKVRDANFFVFDATEREISLGNNATLIQSELIQMCFITYECCFCSSSAKTLPFDCTFQCCSFKKDIATDLDRD